MNTCLCQRTQQWVVAGWAANQKTHHYLTLPVSLCCMWCESNINKIGGSFSSLQLGKWALHFIAFWPVFLSFSIHISLLILSYFPFFFLIAWETREITHCNKVKQSMGEAFWSRKKDICGSPEKEHSSVKHHGDLRLTVKG